MTTPFLIEGPAFISFSMGRTSGFMLRRILDVGIQPDVHVGIANTGVERSESLTFGHDIETRWGVHCTWLEYRPPVGHSAWRFFPGEEQHDNGFAIVTFSTASRSRQPFDALLEVRAPALPNPAQGWCSTELKTRVFKKFMWLHLGYEHWDSVIGLRADEMARVAKRKQQPPERWTNVMPLYDAGVVERDVMSFWKAQSFDLQLEQWEGNCDGCFKKKHAKAIRWARRRPLAVTWWADHESRTGQRFRRDRPPYAKLANQLALPILGDDDGNAEDCTCTD